MSYQKQNFTNGQVLTAEHMNHIEDGIYQVVNRLAEMQASMDGRVTLGEVNLLATGWVGTESPYSQVVTISGVTDRTQVDLKPTIEQLAVFHNKDLAFVTENDDGVVTVYALGDKPSNDYTIQVTLTEVSV